MSKIYVAVLATILLSSCDGTSLLNGKQPATGSTPSNNSNTNEKSAPSIQGQFAPLTYLNTKTDELTEMYNNLKSKGLIPTDVAPMPTTSYFVNKEASSSFPVRNNFFVAAFTHYPPFVMVIDYQTQMRGGWFIKSGCFQFSLYAGSSCREEQGYWIEDSVIKESYYERSGEKKINTYTPTSNPEFTFEKHLLNRKDSPKNILLGIMKMIVTRDKIVRGEEVK